MGKKITRKEYGEYLNNLGRIDDHDKYGTWLRRNDPIGFTVGYQDYKREKEG